MLVSGNYAKGKGGGIKVFEGSLRLINATIAGNRSDSNGNGLFSWDGAVTIRNSIVRDSVDTFLSTPSVTYQNCYRLGPEPGFIDPRPSSEAPTTAGNYRLGEAAIASVLDAGNNDYNTYPVDLDGLTRIVNGQIDLGPYERQDGEILLSALMESSGVETLGLMGNL